MKIVLAGGTGFFGRVSKAGLLQAGYRFRCPDLSAALKLILKDGA